MGGIINLPNKGTLVGGLAKGGESGRERSHSIDGPGGHGGTRQRNRQKCINKLNQYYANEWQSNRQRNETYNKYARLRV